MAACFCYNETMREENLFPEKRRQMVEQQIARRGIRNECLLEAMRQVPRHSFVSVEQQGLAYEDYPLRIGKGQTISQPYVVALMTDLLQLNGDEKVLEVGTGSGYQAAVLSKLLKTVHTIERHAELAEKAQATLRELGMLNVFVHIGDGSCGWPEAAPYDGILVTAAAPKPPQPLLDQLADGGRLVIPVGDRYMQDLQVWQRIGDTFKHSQNINVAFVPLRGQFGWQDEDW
jgi:protein-L-isoaspartate(D-aspartate) O-methyltransferase